jgi:hypothetical protein
MVWTPEPCPGTGGTATERSSTTGLHRGRDGEGRFVERGAPCLANVTIDLPRAGERVTGWSDGARNATRTPAEGWVGRAPRGPGPHGELLHEVHQPVSPSGARASARGDREQPAREKPERCSGRWCSSG